MRITIGVLAVSAASMAACSSSNGSMEGVRSDGLHVTCDSEDEDDVLTCTPEDGDETCETWESGGSAVVLWPPNHKLHRFTLDICAPVSDCDEDDGGDDGAADDGAADDGAADDGDVEVVVERVVGESRAAGVPFAITSITADEAVEVGAGGDGHTDDFDMAIIDDFTFELRSERQGGGDGRVYRVYYNDEEGNPGSCEFLVPHDHRSPFGGAVDSGTVVTVTP